MRRGKCHRKTTEQKEARGKIKTAEAERTTDLRETRAVLSRAILTQSTFADTHIHITAQFLSH